MLKILSKRNLLLCSAILAAIVSPVLLILGLIWWPGFSFKLTLPVYPKAQQIERAYGYYGASSGLEVLYFWTPHSLENVQAYYQEFTLPFQFDPYYGWPLSVFAINGGDLTYYDDIQSTTYEVDGTTRIFCHYSQRYECVNVRLVSIQVDEDFTRLPDVIGVPASSSANMTPESLVDPLQPGTLIIYSYYIHDF